ncbi:MAG TPA: hypothetical protein EYG86_10115 [Crocinitomicaceae bacterium]|nr:hypothetical protein [Crocinitomicaceae bacterium]
MKSGITTITSNSSVEFDLSVGVDTNSLYVSEITFDVSTSILSSIDGIYRPIIGTFTGYAHSYPWYSNQPPADTMVISGSFCLNGLILP